MSLEIYLYAGIYAKMVQNKCIGGKMDVAGGPGPTRPHRSTLPGFARHPSAPATSLIRGMEPKRPLKR
jgi:hypothetical protein